MLKSRREAMAETWSLALYFVKLGALLALVIGGPLWLAFMAGQAACS